MKKIFTTFVAVSLSISAILLAFVFSSNVFAAAPPNIISYQGRILDDVGVPVADATATIIFRIFDGPDTGTDTCLWSNSSATCATATGATVTLTDGLFSENLGDTGDSYAAISDSVFADNTTLYLAVSINGEALTPLKRITGTAFAINAQRLDGFDSSQAGGTSAFIPVTDSNGNLMITGNPQSTAVSGGSLYINPASTDPDEVLFGIALNGSNRFSIDEDGDVFLNGILALYNNETIQNSIDDFITFTGNGGTDDTDFSILLDDATGPVFQSSDIIQIYNNLIIGSSTSATDTLNNGGFTLSGDDTFIAGELGVEDGLFADNTLFVDMAEDSAFLTFSDTTNTDNVSFYGGDGSAGLDGTLSAQAGSLFLDQDGFLWINVDGSTDWSRVATTSGPSLYK